MPKTRGIPVRQIATRGRKRQMNNHRAPESDEEGDLSALSSEGEKMSDNEQETSPPVETSTVKPSETTEMATPTTKSVQVGNDADFPVVPESCGTTNTSSTSGSSSTEPAIVGVASAVEEVDSATPGKVGGAFIDDEAEEAVPSSPESEEDNRRSKTPSTNIKAPEVPQVDNPVTADIYDSNSTLVVRGLPESLVKRIKDIRNTQEPLRGAYYISRVPMNLDWGIHLQYDMKNFIVGPNNFGLRILATGELAACSFMTQPNFRARAPYLAIKTFHTLDMEAATGIDNHYSYPSQGKGPVPYGTILTKRFQTTYGGSKEDQGNVFTECYLCTETLDIWDYKKKHVKYDCTLLKPHDIVVVDMRLKKMPAPGEEDSPKKGGGSSNRADEPSPKKKAKSTSARTPHHVTWFQFEVIFVIHIAPPLPPLQGKAIL